MDGGRSRAYGSRAFHSRIFREPRFKRIDERTERGNPIGSEGFCDVFLFFSAHMRRRQINPFVCLHEIILFHYG